MNTDYNLLFESERFKWCELEGRFYKVDLSRRHYVEDLDFEELLVDYIIQNGSNIVKNFMMIYVRLCMNTIGINLDFIKNKKDLDVVIELFFVEGQEVLDES